MVTMKTAVVCAAVLCCASACTGRDEASVALIALDGASWHVMRPLLEQGQLPALSRMIESGSSGTLKTLDGVRLISPAIWTTVATGKLPIHHGIVDYTQRPLGRPGRRRLVDSTMRTTEAVWTILSSYGIDVGVVGWWATWPTEQVDGFIVSDRFPHTRWEEWHNAEQTASVVYPPSAEPALLRLVKHPADFRPEELSFLLPVTGQTAERLLNKAWTRYDPLIELKHAYLEQQSYVAAARYFLARSKPRFFALYLTLVDVAEHFFWQYLEPEHFPKHASRAALGPVINNAYRHADRIIADLVECLGDDCDYLVVSDHSMLPTGKVPLSGSHYRDRVLQSPEGYAAEELSLDGVIIASGPHIRHGTVSGASVQDVTPTVLHMLGVPVGRDMDGEPLLSMLAPAFRNRQRVEYVTSHDSRNRVNEAPYPAPGEEQVKRKLKALGYLG